MRWHWLAIALAAYGAGHLVTAARLRTLLRGLGAKGLLRDALVANLCSIAVSNLTPGRIGGELVRFLILRRRTELDAGQVTAALAYDRLTDVPPLAPLALALPRTRLGERLGRFRLRAAPLIHALFLSVSMLALDAVRLAAAGRAVGVELSVWNTALLVGVTYLAGLVPTPGGIGAIEGGLAVALAQLGVAPEAVLPLILVERAISLGLGTALSAIALVTTGARDLLRRGRPGWTEGFASVGGALVLVQIGLRFRIDEVRCAQWPSLAIGLAAAAGFALALALMARGWMGMMAAAEQGSGISLRRAFAFGALVHLIAACVPPFLSDDPLAYAAVGRAIGHYGQPASAPLGEALPATEPVRLMISEYPTWMAQGSAYSAGWNTLAAVVSRLAQGDLAWTLRGHQVVGLGSVLVTAYLVSRIAPVPALGAVTVLFCPLLIIDATINAHNDALLMVLAAVVLLFWRLQRHGAAWAVALAGPAVKLSGPLLPVFIGAQYVLSTRGIRASRSRQNRVMIVLFAGFVAAVGAVWPWLRTHAGSTAALFASPFGEGPPHCVRSLECLPRMALFALQLPDVERWVGLAFRAGAALLLLGVARRCTTREELPRAAGAFLVLYYLSLHPYSQPWYLLVSVPFLVLLQGGMRTVAITFVLSSLAQYAFDLPWNLHCDRRPALAVGLEVLKGCVQIVPPTVALLRSLPGRSREPPRGVDGAPPPLPAA